MYSKKQLFYSKPPPALLYEIIVLWIESIIYFFLRFCKVVAYIKLPAGSLFYQQAVKKI